MPDHLSPELTEPSPGSLVSLSNATTAAKVFVALALILPPLMTVTGFGPAWPTTFAVATLTLIASITAFASNQGSISRRWFKRRLIVASALSLVSLTIFAWMISSYTFTINSVRLQGGFEKTAQASMYADDSARNNRPMTDLDLLRVMGMELGAGSVWTRESVAQAGFYTLLSWLVFTFAATSGVVLLAKTLPNREAIAKRLEIERATELVEREPERNRAAWDLARLRLELYFDRNLTQISAIFWLSVAVMLAGFSLILYSINRALNVPGAVQVVSIISASAGVITEFVGATFLFLYRSTVQQATANIRTLERINAVGMAVAILDTISPSSAVLSDQTKADVVKALIGTSSFSELPTSTDK
jgi:hypothetical protein